MAPPPASTNEDTILTPGMLKGILKEGSFTNGSTSRSVNIHRYECGAAAGQLLTISEIIVIPFEREPVLEVKSVSGHHAARVRWLVGDPAAGDLLVEETGALNRHFISYFLSPGLDSKKNENNCQFDQLLHL